MLCEIALWYLLMATTPLVSLFDKEIFVKIKRVPGTAGMACRLLLATFCLCDIPRESQLDTRKNYFAVMVVKYWKRLPREVADALCLSVFSGICTVPPVTCFNFWCPLKWSDCWPITWSLKVPSTWPILILILTKLHFLTTSTIQKSEFHSSIFFFFWNLGMTWSCSQWRLF